MIYTYDGLGSTRYAIDTEGAVAAPAEYNAWGEVIEEKGIYLLGNAGARMYALNLKRLVEDNRFTGITINNIYLNNKKHLQKCSFPFILSQ